MTAVVTPASIAATVGADPSSIEPLAEVVGAGQQVPLVDGSEVAYANLDYAASAPALTAVADAVAASLHQYASVHRGAGHLSQVTTRRYEQCRETVRRFVRGRADDTVVSVSYTHLTLPTM